jgi:alpha-L-glutamate ligase-like protein
MFVSPWHLKKCGMLGLNKRNACFIMPYNPRHLFPLVDNKLETKRLALQHNIAVPNLLGVVEIQHQIGQLQAFLEEQNDFVIKPAHGSGGNGVLVITERQGRNFRKADGHLLKFEAIAHHVSNILTGMYSLGGRADHAMIEYRVKFDPIFSAISYQGVPDIRVIIFRGLPVAGMLRLPTRESDGKANLHQGAMGIGIDVMTGRSCGGVYRNTLCSVHPDTGESTENIEIPHWPTILKLAMQCVDTVGLGYSGVDIVLDRDLGPLMLELNARPGLNVQLANGVGLLIKLNKVRTLEHIPSDIDERMALLTSLYAS